MGVHDMGSDDVLKLAAVDECDTPVACTPGKRALELDSPPAKRIKKISSKTKSTPEAADTGSYLVDCIRKAAVCTHEGRRQVAFYVKWQGEKWADESKWNTWETLDSFEYLKNEAVIEFLRSNAWAKLVKSDKFKRLPLAYRKVLLGQVNTCLE